MRLQMARPMPLSIMRNPAAILPAKKIGVKLDSGSTQNKTDGN
jgi:hypothetical protein